MLAVPPVGSQDVRVNLSFPWFAILSSPMLSIKLSLSLSLSLSLL